VSDTSWFDDLGLGIFLHWGHASSRGWEMSWQMTGGVTGQLPPREPVSCEEYFANASSFDPDAFDAVRWADDIAAAGARYAVFTSKHHDGFAMFDTKLSDYSITRTSPFGRDVLGELVPALRERGLRIGIYFSIIDWHHEDYPRYSDSTIRKPYVLGDYPRPNHEGWRRYRSFMLNQLTELLTRYGPIDICWLDGEFEHSAEEWDFADIRAHIRDLQPNCLVNDRCIGFGDFTTPEQQLRQTPPDGPWELCMTMNDSWSWVDTDHNWKSPHALVERLVETVVAGGNLLLGVGPLGDGTFPDEATLLLRSIGTWVSANAESVHGLRAGLTSHQCRLPTSRRSTSDGERIYVYLTMSPAETLVLQQLPVNRIHSVRWLDTGSELPWAASPSLPDVHRAAADPLGELTITLSAARAASICPVLAIDITAAEPTDEGRRTPAIAQPGSHDIVPPEGSAAPSGSDTS